MTTDKRTHHRHGTVRTRRPALNGRVARSAAGLATVAGVTGGLVGVTGAGPAAAATVSRTLNYTCALHSFSQRAAVTIDADVARTAVVGKRTHRFAIHASSQVSDAGTTGLNWIGVQTVEGRVDAKVHVTAPKDDDADIVVPFTVPRTTVPESGPFDVKGAGHAPARTFDHPGKAKISVGDLVLHVVPRDANGKVNPGETEVSCTLDPGQDPVLASFDITRASTPPGSDPSGHNGGNNGGDEGADPAGTTRPGSSDGSGPGKDGTSHPHGSDHSDPAKGSDSEDGKRGATGRGDGGAKADGKADGSTAPSADATSTGPADDRTVNAAETADQDNRTVVLLTVGGVVVAVALLVVAAFHIRSRAK